MVVRSEFQRVWMAPHLWPCRLTSLLGWVCLWPVVLLGRCSMFLVSLTSWCLQCPSASFPQPYIPTSQGHIAWPPRSSSEIWVEASMTSQLLHSAWLNNQHQGRQCQGLLTAQAIAGPPFTRAVEPSECLDGWAWWNKSWGINSLGSFGAGSFSEMKGLCLLYLWLVGFCWFVRCPPRQLFLLVPVPSTLFLFNGKSLQQPFNFTHGSFWVKLEFFKKFYSPFALSSHYKSG